MRFTLNKTDGTSLDLVSIVDKRSVKSASQSCELLGEDVVTLTVLSASPIDFYIGDTIKVYDHTYTINEMPTCKKSGNHQFEYQVTFEGCQYQLINAVFLLYDSSIRDSYTGTLEDFAKLIVYNANRCYGEGTWELPTNWSEGITDATILSQYETETYTDQNTLSVLQDVCEKWDVEFEIKETTEGVKQLFFSEKIGDVFPYTFKFGATGGLYEINKQKNTDESFVTRLYCFGGSSNIPTTYGYDRLCVYDEKQGGTSAKNKSYVQDDSLVNEYGVIEGTYTNEKIYPQYIGEITSLGDNEYTFTDSAFPFDLGEVDEDGNTRYLINGVNAKVIFQTGNLAGYEFEIDKDRFKYTEGEGIKLVLIQYKDELGQTLPMPSSESAGAGAYQFAIGDKYIITDIYMPDAYLHNAEKELLADGKSKYEELNKPKAKYSLSIDQKFLQGEADALSVKNLFSVGDSIPVNDDDTGITTNVRISSFTRDLLQPYSYELELGDVNVSSVTKTIKQIANTQQVIKTNKLDDTGRRIRNWRTTQEVLDNVFDTEGNYFTEKIKPLSIETKYLAVGAKSTYFNLQNVVFQPNYGGDENVLKTSEGRISHYAVIDDSIRSWLISESTTTLEASSLYYIYVKCPKEGTTAEMVVSTRQYQAEQVDGYYYFMVGTISSVLTDNSGNYRQISLSYGATTINGRWVQTGRISSADGDTYFDLDSGEIHGNIKFKSSKTGADRSLNDLENDTTAIDNYARTILLGKINDLQDQIDDKIDQWFKEVNPTMDNEPASTWTTTSLKESHLGDLYYNTTNSKVWRFVKDSAGTTYSWSLLSDSDATEALSLAQDALATAKEKRQIWIGEQPKLPYYEGDVWLNSGVMYVCISDSNASFDITDWANRETFVASYEMISYKKLIDNQFVQVNTSLDNKIETWLQSADPSSAWSTAEIQAKHFGDVWIKTNGAGEQYIYMYELNDADNTYYWQQVTDQTAVNAAKLAASAKASADGKITIYYSQPTDSDSYKIGDLWLKDGEFLRSIADKAEGEAYDVNDWVVATIYDNTTTAIDGGIVTTGTVKLAGNDGSIKAGITGDSNGSDDGKDVRIWAGASYENRNTAPFRVTQAGNLVATNADIEGKVTATSGKIANFSITNNHIGVGADENGMSIFADYIKFQNDYLTAKIGVNDVPASFSNQSASTSANNVAIRAVAQGSKHGNYALLGNGDINTTGIVTGGQCYIGTLAYAAGDEYMLDMSNDFNDKVIITYSNSYKNAPIYLPCYLEMIKHCSLVYNKIVVKMTIVLNLVRDYGYGATLTFDGSNQKGNVVGDATIKNGAIDLLIVYESSQSATAYVTNRLEY